VPTTSPVNESIDGPEPGPEPVDGRTARAVRTRQAIVDACIALVEQGELRPTAPRIAGVAGVSVRSVFQHFDDLDTLFLAVGNRMVERIRSLVLPIDNTRPLSERVPEFIEQRCAINEFVSPIRTAAMVHAPTSDAINELFRNGHGFYRAQVAEVFAPELEAAGDQREAAFMGLMVSSSWPTWNLLRTVERKSAEEARESIQSLVTAILDGMAGSRS
jgi:AcrR family transcriptional regulator